MEVVPHYSMIPGAVDWESKAPIYVRPPDTLGRPSKLEDKTAVSEAMKFLDNKRDQIRWVKTTQNYFIGKYPELKYILEWIEAQQTTVITAHHFGLLRIWKGLRGNDPAQLSDSIWSYLNLVMANATNRSAFDNAEAGNGFDAWRRIVVPLGPRSAERMHEMHKDVTYPPPSRALTELEADLNRWEADLEEYYRCGGEHMQPKTKLMTAKNMIPKGTNPAVHLAVRNCVTYEEFRQELRATITYLSDRGVIGGAQVHVGTQPYEPLPKAEDFPPGTLASPEAANNYVLVIPRFAQRRQRQAARRSAANTSTSVLKRTPPRDVRDMKCANCNQQGHTAMQCNRPKVPNDQRKCHTCGKVGHLARACPEKGQDIQGERGGAFHWCAR